MRMSLTIGAAAAAIAVTATAAVAQDWRYGGPGIGQYEAVAIARANGVVRIHDVEREDGGWEVEGRDRRGRDIEIEIDNRGRVTEIERDDDWRRASYGRGVTQGEAVAIARRYGIVRIDEVEREDGGWEVEGRDRRGREIEIEINSRGRVTHVEYDD